MEIKTLANSAKFWPSTFYFFFFAALSTFGPFIALYYQSLGISGGQIGLLLAIPPLVTLGASPFWTGLADASHRHKPILVITMAAVIVAASFVPWVTDVSWLFPLIVVFAFFGAPIIPLVDSATISMLGQEREKYGRLRMWGTVGWAIVAPLAGIVFERHGLWWMFPAYASLMAFGLLSALNLKFARNADQTPFFRGIRAVLTDRRWIMFLLMTFVAAAGLATVSSYLMVLMGELGAGKSLMGFSLLVSTISEIPVMFFGNVLLKRFKSRGLLALAMGVTGIRCILYFFAGTPLAVLGLHLFHGFTYPAFFLAGVNYAAENAPPGLGATAQGLFASMLVGFGSAAGNLIGGILIERFGTQAMYGIIGIATLAGLGIFMAMDWQAGRPVIAKT